MQLPEDHKKRLELLRNNPAEWAKEFFPEGIEPWPKRSLVNKYIQDMQSYTNMPLRKGQNKTKKVLFKIWQF